MAGPIEGVATAFPAFIGYTGEAEKPGEPVWVASLAQYRAAFGGAAAPPGFRLDAAIRAFYANGGDDAFVLSLGPYAAAGPPDPVPLLDGLERIGNEAGPTLLLAPDALRLARADYHVVVRAVLAQCKALGDRMAIFDLHGGDDPASHSVAGSAPLIADFREAVVDQPGRSYGMAWHPWLVGADGAVTPPSAAIAGIYARTDREQGVWRTPTNIGPATASDVTFRYREPDLDELNRPDDGVAINALRYFNELGVRVWGARTLDGNSNSWRYVPVRRLLIYIQQSVQRGLLELLFEPNAPPTWLEARRLVENFLTALWREGALQGVTTDKAFYVRCGLGTTMGQHDIDEGRLIVEIGVATVRPAEFIVLMLALMLGGGG
jgi:phage tail sheath protein FI